MMLWKTLFCLLSANLVLSQLPPAELLARNDQDTTLIPLKDTLEGQGSSSDNPHVIRGLLMGRQTGCPTGYGECTNPAGRCCPLDGSCCQGDGCCKNGYWCYSTGCCPLGDNGCEGNSCCSPGQGCCKGGGCCDPGYYCATVNGQRGCCPNGSTCTNTGGGNNNGNNNAQCTTDGYVPCPGEDFCCPAGYQCYRDTSNAPKCRLPTSNVPPTLTNTNTGTDTPIATYVPPTTTSNTRGPSTAVVPGTTSRTSSTPTPSQAAGNSGLSSSALSVGVDALLNLFAGVGVLAYLF